MKRKEFVRYFSHLYSRPILTGTKAKIFINLFSDADYQKIAQLKYVEGKTLEECSVLMNYSKRQIERLHTQMKDIAIIELLNLVESDTENAIKLLKIKNILNGE